MPWFILAALALAVSPGPGPVPGYIPGDGGGLGVCSPSSVRLTGSLRKSLVSHSAAHAPLFSKDDFLPWTASGEYGLVHPSGPSTRPIHPAPAPVQFQSYITPQHNNVPYN